MTCYWFDIDGTLADTNGKKYYEAKPIPAMINMVNMLYDQGHHIIIFTARGGTSGIDWRRDTMYQLYLWGVKYHELIMGYPKDVVVDDRALRPDEFLEVI